MKNPRSLQILKSCSTAAALALGLCGSAAFAQVSFTEWTATTGTPGWGAAANWSPGVVPSAPGAIVNINSNIGAAGLVITIPTGTTEVVGVLSLGDLSGNEGAFTINAAGAGATLEMNGNGGWAFINRITGASSAANVINVPITLSSLLNVNINTANNNAGLTINGIISGSKGLLLSGGGRLTMTGANTYTGNTQIANRGFGDSANPNLILSNVSANAADNAIAGHLLIGNASRGGTGSAVVHLGASEQIADDKYIRMDGTSGNNAFFKMLGHEETVRGIIDHTREGVIEVTQDEGTPTGTVGGIGAQANSTLTLNTQAGDVFYYGGYLRNRSGGSSTAVLNLIVKGAGTQILAGDRISYTGVTQVDGATLVLFDVRDGSSNNRFSSDVTLSNNATLEFRVNNTWNGFNRVVSGTGNIIRTGDTTATLNYTSSVTVAGDLTIAGHAGSTNFSGALTSFEDFRMLRPLLNMADNSIVRFQGASATFSGSFMVEGPLSQVIVQGALNVAGDVTLKRSYMSIQPGASGTLTANKISLYGRPGVNEGYLEIRNTGSANLTDRVNAAPIDSYGGTISFAHDGSANAFSEGLGTLNLIRGSSQIITTKATGGTSALSFAGITRTAGSGATIDFTGTDLGADLQNRILIGGAVPSDDGIIGGWATVNGNEFAVYGANGVQALNNAGTNQDVWTATTVNAKMIASQSATVVKTINSLNIQQTSGALTLTLGAVAGADLIIESGGLLSSGNNHVIAGTNSASITAGNSVGTANDEFFINVLNNTLRIDASIVERSGGSTLSLVKSGAGTLQLNNANTYRGPTRLNNGILSISNQNQLGANTADIIFNGGTLLANATVTINDAGRDITVTEAGGTLRVNQNATLTITRPINAVGAVVFDTTSGGTGPNILNLNGNNTFAGGLETINAITTAVMNVTGSNTMSHIRVIGGSVNLGTNGVSTNTINGDIRVEVGDLTLFGTNNFSGKVVLNGGRLILGGANSLTHSSGSFALQATGGFSLNGNSVTVNELTGGSTTNGKIDNGSASAAKIIINQESNTTYAGDIMDTAFSQGTTGKLSLTKTGNGNLALTGNGSDYSGVTEILGGTITVNKLGLGGFSETSSIGSGYLASDLILNGGTLRFNGTSQSVTDRSFTLGVGDEAGFLIADGTSRNAILTFGDSTYSDAVAFTGSGSRTLTLGGFNVGDNTFNLILGDGTGGRTSLNKTGNGTWILTRGNTYTGKTVVTGGVLGVTANGALGAAAGDAVVLMGGQSVSGFPVGGVLDLRNVNYSDTKTLVLEGGMVATTTGDSTWAGKVLVGVNSNVLVRAGASLTFSGALGGRGSITQYGEGTVVLAGNNIVTAGDNVRNVSSASYTVLTGTLRLDYTNNAGGKLTDQADLTLGGSRQGGKVELKGGAAGTVETIASLTLNAGDNEITRLDGEAVLQLNTINRNAGSTINFGQDNIASLDRFNVNGILGGWATVGGTDWAMNSGSSTVAGANGAVDGNGNVIGVLDGYVRKYTNYTVDVWGATKNTTVQNNNTQTNATTNTLRFGDAGPLTVTLNGVNTISTGGLLVTAAVGANDITIAGTGALTPGTSAALASELVLIQNNLAGDLVISAVVGNNTSGGQLSGIDKLGDGKVVLAGLNTFTGITTINAGVLSVNSIFNATATAGTTASALGASSNAASNLVMNGGTLQYTGGTTSTDRGFTINYDGRFDVTNENSSITFTGQMATPGTEGDYIFTKMGAGTMVMNPTASTAMSGYGITGYNVVGGRLQLMMRMTGTDVNAAGNNNRFARSDIATLTVGGGTFELVGAANANLQQVLPGQFTVGEGASQVWATSQIGASTSLFLQDAVEPKSVVRLAGGTVTFVENAFREAGTANIFLRNLAIEQNTVLSWATYWNRTDLTNLNDFVAPGVNDFALVSSTNNDIVDADSQSVYFVAAPASNAANAANWDLVPVAQRYFSEGSAVFSGTTDPGDLTIQLLRYYRQEAGTVNISGKLILQQGAILAAAHIGNFSKTITGGQLTSNFLSSTGADLMMHNWNPAAAFTIGSTIVDPGTVSRTTFQLGDTILQTLPTGLVVGMPVSGAGIPAGTVIVGIDSANGYVFLNKQVSIPYNPLGTAINYGSGKLNFVHTGLSVGNQTQDVVVTSTTIIGNLTNGNATVNMTSVDGLKIGMKVLGANIPLGTTILDIDTVNNTILLSQNPNSTIAQGLNFYEIATIGSYQTGVGTTVLTGTNTYTGTTFLHGGVLRLNSAGALPGGIGTTGGTSHIKFNGGVLGLGFNNFTRGLGLGDHQFEFAGSGGFAAYGANRSVNIGGASALMTWDKNYFVPAGGTLILGAPDSGYTIDFQNPINLGSSDRVVRADNSSADVDAILSGNLTGTDTGAFIKTGLGTLSLTGSNTYKGGTVLGNGRLLANNPATAFGTGNIRMGDTSDSTIDDFIHLDLGAGTLSNNIVVGTRNSTGVSLVSGTGNVNFNGATSLGRRTYISSSAGGKNTFNGVVSGAGGMTVIGGGTVELTQANTYGTGMGTVSADAINGGTIIRSGTVRVGHSNGLGSSVVELGDAIKPIVTPASTVDRATNGASMTLKGGVFMADHNGASTTPDGAGPGAFVGVDRTVDGNLYTAADVGKRILVKDEGGNPEQNGVYEIVSVTGNTMNLRRVADPDGSVKTKYGTTVLVLNGTSANTTYFAATQTVNNLNRGDTDPVVWVKDANASDVALLASVSGVTINNLVDINANGTATSTIGGASDMTGTAVFNGNVTMRSLAAAAETEELFLTSSSNTGNGVTFNGIFSESDSLDILTLTKIGTGVVTLNGANTYKGQTIVSQGLLRIKSSTALGATTAGTRVNAGAGLQLDGSGGNLNIVDENITLNGDGVLGSGALQNIAGNNVYTGVITLETNSEIQMESGSSLEIAATSSITGVNRELTVDGAGNLNIKGVISIGTGGLTKNGSGKLTLSGANTYTGNTLVNVGELVVNNLIGSSGTGSGGVTVAQNARLSGGGYITPATAKTLSIQGTLAPGDGNVAGKLTINTSAAGSTLQFASTGVLTFDLFTAGGDQTGNLAANDRLAITGNLDIQSGAKLQVNTVLDSMTFVAGDSWKLFEWGAVTRAGTDFTVTPTLDLPQLSAGLSWSLANLYTTGTITVVPEPGRMMLMLFGLLAIFGRRRR